jgi:spermidine synthase
MAGRYFGLGPKDAGVFVMDARRFLAETRETYDFIIGDAYGSSSVPWHLLTREYLALLAGRLAPDGIVALNIESVGWHDPLVRSAAATLATQMPEVRALPVIDPPDALGNVVVVGSRRPLDFSAPDSLIGHPKDFLPEPYRHWVVVTQNHAWNNAFVPDFAGVPVMTDDRTPVDLWAERINREARKGLHGYFGRDDISW